MSLTDMFFEELQAYYMYPMAVPLKDSYRKALELAGLDKGPPSFEIFCECAPFHHTDITTIQCCKHVFQHVGWLPTPQRKNKVTAYQVFLREKMLAGMTLQEANDAWKHCKIPDVEKYKKLASEANAK